MKDRHTNRPPHNFIDLVDKRFGKLTVIKDSGIRKSRRPLWDCVCDCGKETRVLGKYLHNGDTKSCGCVAKGNAHNRNAVGGITASLWAPISNQAARRGIPFEVTREDAWELFIRQDRKCALSGIPIEFAINLRDSRDQQTASLDRIDNSMGYRIDNLQWVHKKLNIMKNVMGNAEFIEWCKMVQSWNMANAA